MKLVDFGVLEICENAKCEEAAGAGLLVGWLAYRIVAGTGCHMKAHHTSTDIVAVLYAKWRPSRSRWLVDACRTPISRPSVSTCRPALAVINRIFRSFLRDLT